MRRSVVPRPNDSDVDNARYYGDDIPGQSTPSLTIEESWVGVQLARLYPCNLSDEDEYEWLVRRRVAIRSELRRRATTQAGKGGQ